MLMTWVLHGPALLGAWTDWPPLFAWTSTPLCSYNFSARWFCHTLQVHTAPSLHLPLFLEETFLHTLVSPLFMECKLHMGQSTFKASKQQWQQRGIAWTGPSCCMDRLPPPPLLCMDQRSSLFLRFSRQVVLPYLAGTHYTIPTQGAAP